jgi:hypothetical protein
MLLQLFVRTYFYYFKSYTLHFTETFNKLAEFQIRVIRHNNNRKAKCQD